LVARIVGAIGLPHNPNFPELAAQKGTEWETAQSYRRLASEVKSMHPDVILIFTTDHLNTFFFENFPILAIGVGEEFAGPNDEVVTVSRRIVPSREAFARHLHSNAVLAGFDVALVQEFEVDHSTIVPLHFLTPQLDVPVVPIFISAHNPPRPSSRRCFHFGEAMRAAVESWREPLRVVVIGSGSFSFDVHGHLSPAGRPVGVPDPAWVYRVCEHLERNTITELLDEATPDRFSQAGNVSGEVLNWIAMIGTIADHKLSWSRAEPQFGNCYAVWK
jgi:hypothetical protein